MTDLKFSIVIPLYNEYLNIRPLLNEIYKSLDGKGISFEIILINDGSSDNTNEIITDIKKNYKNLKIINHKKNLGQSRSLLTGISNSLFDNIITLDGDGQNDPKDIIKLIKVYLKNEFQLVGGMRLKRNDKLIKIISSKIANFVRRNILDDGCLDTGCSLKIFKKNIFLQFPFFDGIHRFLPALFKGFDCKTFFIEVNHRPRKYGDSKYGTLDRLVKGIGDLFKVVKIIKKFKRNNA